MSIFEKQDQTSERSTRRVSEPAQQAGAAAAGRVQLKTWEMVAWILLAVSAVLTRFVNLGTRVMSHDESLHVYYSWWLANGRGYVHNPMMHGPFLFEFTAFFNRLFGANDFTSRLLPALLGIIIVLVIPWLLRPWLGRFGSAAASLFFLVSPYVLFYSRYNRHDIEVITFALLAVFAMLAYRRDRQAEDPSADQWLLLLAISLALMFSAFEITFIYLAIFAGFILIRLLFISGIFEGRFSWDAARRSAEFDLLIVLATLGAFFSSPIALLVLNPLWSTLTGAPFVDISVLSSQSIEWAYGPTGPRLWALLGLFWAASAAVGIWWGRLRWLKLAGLFLVIDVLLFTTFGSNKNGFGTGFIGSLGYWLSQHSVARGAQPDYYYLIVFPFYEFLPIVGGLLGAVTLAVKGRRLTEQVQTFVLFVLWWGALIWLGLSIAGEKMPWLSTHITVPFILLAAWFTGYLLQPGDSTAGELAPREIRRGVRYAGLGLVALLLVVTIRSSYLVNYVNYDYTTEFVGYAHAAPGVRWTMEDIEKIAATPAGENMKVAYDNDVSWPMAWYLRDYQGFFGNQPSRPAVEGAQVVVVSPDNFRKVESYIGANYHRYEVIRMWWPMEDYKNLTWERIWNAITDPEMRAAVWQIWWNRDYTKYAALTGQVSLNPPAQWPLEDRMRVYIRKDIADQIPNLALSDYQLEDITPAADAYQNLRIDPDPLKLVTGDGLNSPRNLAFGPDGSIYVADSGFSRIVKLDAQGQVITTWGSRTPDGEAPAPGTMNEPWGIAADAQGNIYVADTWNHRIQKFDQNGAFLLEWGMGGLRAEGPDRFWGPRAVAVGEGGRVYVTDTGNKRVGVFDANGGFLFDFDTSGDAALDEPVGIAIGPDGLVYVADTWNMRVAVFDPDGNFVRSWPVQGWGSSSIDNKPYLAVDDSGRVYLTDPEGFRVIVFTTEGQPLAVFGQYGIEEDAFGMPNGIAVDSSGSIWVVDAGNHRINVYPGLED